MRNIARINNYANRLQARRDWQELARQAIDTGHGDLVEKFAPDENDSWRKIDKCIAKLRDAMAEA